MRLHGTIVDGPCHHDVLTARTAGNREQYEQGGHCPRTVQGSRKGKAQGADRVQQGDRGARVAAGRSGAADRAASGRRGAAGVAFRLPETGADQPQAWSLGRVGGKPIALAHSLTEEGVVDGDVLELRAAEVGGAEAYVEDVRDAVEDSVDAGDDLWANRTTQGFVLMAAGVAMAALPLLPAVREPHQAGSLLAAVLAAVLLGGAAWWAGRNTYVRAATVLVTVAAGWGGLAGWLLATWLGAGPVVAFGAALVYLTAIVVICRGLTSYATPHLAACAVLVPAGLAAMVTSLAGGSIDDAVLVDMLLAILLTGALPRASIAVGGLAAADFRLRNVARISEQELTDRVRQSTYLLTGSLTGAALVVAAGVGWLIRSTTVWGLLLLPVMGRVVAAPVASVRPAAARAAAAPGRCRGAGRSRAGHRRADAWAAAMGRGAGDDRGLGGAGDRRAAGHTGHHRTRQTGPELGGDRRGGRRRGADRRRERRVCVDGEL
nr:EsaB/YukD family protein [Fodinicola feengrottensis]